MPTADRPIFVPHAIRYFLRQDYPNKELVIIDDGVKAVAGLIPNDPRIRYYRLSQKLPIGTKRNLACEAARGDLIAHWDDDDWVSARRLSYQIGAMLSAEGEVCGIRQMLFYKIATGNTWLYRLPSAFWKRLIGGSLIYTRDFWRRGPFPPVWEGEDTRFISHHFSMNALEKAVYLSDFKFYVALAHSNNTTSYRFRGLSWARWQGDLAGIMGDDLSCYPPFIRRRIR